jgi:hypothetical protein
MTTAAQVIADAKLPFDLEPGQRAYLTKVCADRNAKKIRISAYSPGGSIKLRWDMGWRSNRALTYYSPLKSKLLTRRTRLACDECNGTGTVLEFQDFPGATTDDYTSTPCPVCTKLIATATKEAT